MFSSFLSMTLSFISKTGALILNIFTSMGPYKCVFSWGMVGICALVFLGFLLKGRIKSAIAVFLLLGASTYTYDFVGCNDCGNKLPLSHHFGGACPAETSVPLEEEHSASPDVSGTAENENSAASVSAEDPAKPEQKSAPSTEDDKEGR